MALIYTLISYGIDKVLTDYTEYQGNFETISQSLIKNVQPNHRATFSYEKTDENYTIFMTMCNANFPVVTAFTFLETLQKEFNDKFKKSQIEKAIRYSLNDAFKEKIMNKMEYYNKNKDVVQDNISRLKEGVLAYKNEVLEAEGEKMNIIVNKADGLRQGSKFYYSAAKKVKDTSKKRKIIIICFIVLIILVIAYFISVIACKGFAWQGCRN